MADVRDYLDWRGDLSFKADAFNEIDALILSQFAYLDFTGIIKEGFELALPMKEIGKRYFAAHGPEESKNLTILLSNCEGITRKMILSDRFKRLYAFNYVDKYDSEESIQFSAVTIKIDNKKLFVAFRGTDDSLAGWQEDFKLCYMTPVQAQLEAVEYLKEVCEWWDGEVILGGHSKGGNLAIYATMQLEEHLQAKVTQIYSFDGPGFLKDIVETEAYKRVIDRTITFLPQGSYVGMIMYNTGVMKVVKSTNKGFMQHAPVSWQIRGKNFENSTIENYSLLFNECTKNWVDKIDSDKKEQFINSVFYLLKSGEMETFTEMSTEIPQVINRILRSYAELDKETKKMMRSIMMEAIKIGTITIKQNRIDGRKEENGF